MVADIGRLVATARGSLVTSLLTSARGLAMVGFGATVFLSRVLDDDAAVFGV